MKKVLVIKHPGYKECRMPWGKEIQCKMKISHDDIESLEEGRTLWTFESAMYLEEEENEATGS